MSASFFEAVAC